MLSSETLQLIVVLVQLLVMGGSSPTVLCRKKTAVRTDPCLWELLLAKALMLGPCLSFSPTALQSCPAWPHAC